MKPRPLDESARKYAAEARDHADLREETGYYVALACLAAGTILGTLLSWAW